MKNKRIKTNFIDLKIQCLSKKNKRNEVTHNVINNSGVL